MHAVGHVARKPYAELVTCNLSRFQDVTPGLGACSSTLVPVCVWYCTMGTEGDAGNSVIWQGRPRVHLAQTDVKCLGAAAAGLHAFARPDWGPVLGTRIYL